MNARQCQSWEVYFKPVSTSFGKNCSISISQWWSSLWGSGGQLDLKKTPQISMYCGDQFTCLAESPTPLNILLWNERWIRKGRRSLLTVSASQVLCYCLHIYQFVFASQCAEGA